MSILCGSSIQQFIKKEASRATSIRIAAPFWGADAIDLLGLKKNPDQTRKAFRLICNLESGACNPAPIRDLKNQLGWGARTHKRLHAKVYIFDDCAVVGSANPSANGLALEETEMRSWHEVCTIVSEEVAIKCLVKWFDELFDHPESAPVELSNLAVAEKLWEQRRKDTRNVLKLSGISLKEMAEGDQGPAILESTWLWIYEDGEVSSESTTYNSQLRRDYGKLHPTPYEVETNPARYHYDKVVDCFYSRRKNGRLIVHPTLYRLHPELSMRLKEGESKGYWTLPATKVYGAESKILDDKSIDWIRAMISKKLDKVDEWEGTLGQLLSDTTARSHKQ